MSSAVPLIHATGLTKGFGDFTAVNGIDFDVPRGEAFGFLGPNGAGKFSTPQMVGCVSPVSAGELTLFGLGLDPATDGPQIRARLGVVSQLFFWTRSSPSRRTAGSQAATSACPSARCGLAQSSCSPSPRSPSEPGPRSSRYPGA